MVSGADVVNDFQTGFEPHGLPASVLTDNAAMFTGRPRGYGQAAFEKLLAGLHIEQPASLLRLDHQPGPPHANHPCGKFERLRSTGRFSVVGALLLVWVAEGMA